MTWGSSPRHGMVANSKHHLRQSRDQIHKESSSNGRKRSRSRSKSRSRTSAHPKRTDDGVGARDSAGKRCNNRRPVERAGSSCSQKRRRSRSCDRSVVPSRQINHHHNFKRTDVQSSSSSSFSKEQVYKKDWHHKERERSSTHYRNSGDSKRSASGDKRRSSPVLSIDKRKASTAPSSSRSRDSVSSVRKHHRSSSSPVHRHHNKPSALVENRDTSKRDHASRSSRSSRSCFPEPHNHNQQQQQPRQDPLSSSAPATPSATAASSSSTNKSTLDELRNRTRNTPTAGQGNDAGSSNDRNFRRRPPDRQNGSFQKKLAIRSGDENGYSKVVGHSIGKKKKLPISGMKGKVYKRPDQQRYIERSNCQSSEDVSSSSGKRPVGDTLKKRRDSSVLFPSQAKLSTGGIGGAAARACNSQTSRGRDTMSSCTKRKHGSSLIPRDHNNKPSALVENRDSIQRDQDCRSSRSRRRSLSKSQKAQLQPRRDSSSSASSLSTTVASSTTKIVLAELNGSNTADEYEELTQVDKWVRSAPDELYYSRQVDGHATATERTQTLCVKFEGALLAKPKKAREEAEQLGDERMSELIKVENALIAEQKQQLRLKKKGKGKCCHSRRDGGSDSAKDTEGNDVDSCSTSSPSSEVKKCRHSSGETDNNEEDESGSSSSSDSSSEDEDGFSMTRSDTANRELERRKKHPRRLHEELWHNDPGLMNDGPVCRCSAKARRFGIRHGFYPGEDKISRCDHFSNNKARLFHYRITISPPKNFLISTPTVINHDGHEYIFEGFSIFAHHKLDLTLPPCKVIRFNIKYDVFVEEERFPESFCVKELLLFETYLFREILELVDLKYDWNEETGCSQFHLMPRFVRQLPDNGQEILSMSRVLIHLLKGDRDLVKEEDLHKLYTVEQSEWQNFADRHKGTIVTKWGMKPCAIRVDQIDRDISGQEVEQEDGIPFPLIVHFGIRPPQLSYAGNAGYQRAWRRYVKYRHLLSNMPKPSPRDKLKLLQKEMKLQAMRTASNMKRDVTVAISAKGFRTTGICCDLVQHAMLIPVLVAHLRFHKCLETLEMCMVYPFKNRFLLQLAMTHPSYRENFGTNPDHARNALTNCGIRQPEYGDRRIHYASTRKRGINTLINIMAKFGADQETESDITHNERLEFLGDAVVEFTTSIHLFHIFPDLEEGGLATYRAAIVQNQHLAVLAQALNLDQYMLYAHGSDLCHDSELRHAMANCFEALMGALFLDGGIHAADRVFGGTLFGTDPVLLDMWANYPRHPLQQEEPDGDRHWVESHQVLQKLATFETSIGVAFNHIRLLARAFTDRSLGYNNLTKGSNQRLEFLGDTVLQLISSEYLYRHFPDHHEGHLSLLRSSLVNNRTQSLVCEDLGMPQYAMRGDPKSEMKTKDKADLLEAFLGSLYIDKGLKYCILFCQVCFFPRLSNSITKQEWNDPKSKLQQCCLTLRAMDGREPDIPVYKVTESLGPTNTRTYIVAVYFRGKRLATAQGHSIQEAEMNAAAEALEVSGHLFPQLHHQRRIMDKTKKVH